MHQGSSSKSPEELMLVRCWPAVGLALFLVSCSPSPADLSKSIEPIPNGSAEPAKVPATEHGRPKKSTRTNQPVTPPTNVGTETVRGDTSPAALVEKAEKSYDSHDLATAIRFLEEALKGEPKSLKALILLGIYAQQRADDLERPASSPFYLQSAQAVRKLLELDPDFVAKNSVTLSSILYNEACTYAVEGQPEKALDSLAEAIDVGFGMIDLLDSDAELTAIRKSPRFLELRALSEENARIEAERKARKLADDTKPFPLNFALPGLDGKMVSLSEVEGEVTIVTLWGTWCAPCRREISRFREMLKKYGGQGLKIVGISYERGAAADARRKVREFAQKHEIDFPCLIGDDALLRKIPGFLGYPTTFFLDHSGTVRVVAAGERSAMELEAILSLLMQPQAQQ
jgi:cytochrome c biogenesis protein CcmG, thiol:disulfide interchange protein DsbE